MCALLPAAAGAEPVPRSLTQTAVAQPVPGTSSGNLVLACAAVATGDVVATSVTSCYALGANGVKYHAPRTGAKPGPADASVSAVLSVPPQRYKACMSAQVVYSDGSVENGPTACSG